MVGSNTEINFLRILIKDIKRLVYAINNNKSLNWADKHPEIF